jgi:hypothetical protein
MRTFHEKDGTEIPFRLSYHGRSHYNSIVPLNWNYDKVFFKSKPGHIEDEAIHVSKIRKQEEVPDGLSRDEQKKIQNIRLIAQIINRSREEFKI